MRQKNTGACYKRSDFDFDIIYFLNLDGDFPCLTSYGGFTFLIRFARVSSHVTDFNALNIILLLIFSYVAICMINFEKRFQHFTANYELGTGPVGTRILCLVYKFIKRVSRADFSDQFRKNIICYNRIGYKINIMRQCI